MKIRTIIVDDEPPAREGIRLRLQPESDISIVGEYGSAREAMEAIRKSPPDLLFLDVQMPGMTGIEMMRAVGPDLVPAVVLVTAFEEHALDAFEVNVVDYVLKPIDTERFRLALSRARTKLERARALRISDHIENLLAHLDSDEFPEAVSSREATTQVRYVSRFLVSDGAAEKLVDVGRIDWIEAAGDYLRLHEGSTYHLVRATLNNLEHDLDPAQFARIHRGTIVRVDRVERIVPMRHGDAEIHLNDGTILRMSRSYRAAFRRSLKVASESVGPL